MERKTIEVFVVVDADGDYVVGADQDQVNERYTDEIEGVCDRRTVKVVLEVELPQIQELRGVCPAAKLPSGLIEVIE